MTTKSTQVQGTEPEFAKYWSNFQPFRWKWVNRLTRHPWYFALSMIFIYMGLDVVDKNYSTQYYLLGHWPSVYLILFGGIPAFTLLIRWRFKIPSIFQWLWEDEQLESRDGEFGREFNQYLHNYQNELHSKVGSLSIGIGLMAVVLIMFIAVNLHPFLSQFFDPIGVAVFYILMVIAFVWIFIIGQFGWVLITTGRFLGKLTKSFRIKIQPSHPDQCGGLKPLGDFSFDAALPVIALGLILATIRILNLDIDSSVSDITSILLIVFIGPMALLTVFIPLWDIHREMVSEKRAYQNKFADQVRLLEAIIRTHTGESGDLDKAKIAREKLEILQMLHPNKLAYPVWPFPFAPTVIAIFSPQILQTVFGIATGIFEFIRNLQQGN